MHRLYGRAEQTDLKSLHIQIILREIKKAAEESNWETVNQLYKQAQNVTHSELDQAISEGTLNVLFSCDHSSELSKTNAYSYLLRALTLSPSATTKLNIFVAVKATEGFAYAVKSGEIGRLFEKSVDIYTAMLGNTTNYEEALEYVNSGKSIPYAAVMQQVVTTLTQTASPKI